MTHRERKIARRREVVAVLDELAAAGLITYEISSEALDGPEPEVRVSAEVEMLNEPLPAGLSREAAAMWQTLVDFTHVADVYRHTIN